MNDDHRPPLRLEREAAHELANLIGGIALLAEQALESVAADDPLHEDLRLICASSERVLELTRELLGSPRASEPDDRDAATGR